MFLIFQINYKNNIFLFIHQNTEKMLGNKIVYFKKICKLGLKQIFHTSYTFC